MNAPKLTFLIVLCLLANLLILRCDCSKNAGLKKEEKALMEKLKKNYKPGAATWEKLKQDILPTKESPQGKRMIQQAIHENRRILQDIEQVEKSNFTALPEFRPGYPEIGLIGRVRKYTFTLRGDEVAHDVI